MKDRFENLHEIKKTLPVESALTDLKIQQLDLGKISDFLHNKDVGAHFDKFSEYELMQRQRELVLECLSDGQPKTLTMLCRETRLWQPQLKRAIAYHTKKETVKCLFMDTCPIRGKRAGFYSIVKTQKP